VSAARSTHRRGGVEVQVWRDRDGRIRKAPAGLRALVELRTWARRAVNMEDRTGPPLRYGSAGVAGWWYMVKGPKRWIRREHRPGWHHGYYYSPRWWMPVVPPRDSWEGPHSYHGIPGQTPLSHVVPDQVRAAAQLEPEELTGRRTSGDGSALVDAWRVRARRAQR